MGDFVSLSEMISGLQGKRNSKQKRRKLTATERIYIWEHPKTYGRVCNICHQKIIKLSDLELDHIKAHSKGGRKLALAHKECNRMKGTRGLRDVQKRMGFGKTKTTKKRKAAKRRTKNPYEKIFGPPIKIKPIRW